MSQYVIDASALVLAVVGREPAADDLRARFPTIGRHAPHLIDAEVGNVLRRHEAAGLVSADECAVALAALPSLVEHRYPHTGPLGESAWRLRKNLTFYDALYVALAAHLGTALLTADARIARAPGLPCPVELV